MKSSCDREWDANSQKSLTINGRPRSVEGILSRPQPLPPPPPQYFGCQTKTSSDTDSDSTRGTSHEPPAHDPGSSGGRGSDGSVEQRVIEIVAEQMGIPRERVLRTSRFTEDSWGRFLGYRRTCDGV